MSLAAGSRIGPYEVIALIGVGGMGEVYRARDHKLVREVAIKTLPAALEDDRDRLARFRREARALASLNHPNIAAIYGLEEVEGVTYLILELADGETLTERLSRTGPLATGEVLRISSQIADALEAAHAKGITHRDIKPSNIKLTGTGRVKVLDFGLAKSRGQLEIQDEVSTQSAWSELLSAPGAIVGTPPYMSPEQIRGQVTDQRSDIWAFGCVIYELLSAKRAFSGSSTPDILAAILRGEPEWDALPADVPDSLRRLVRKCLDKDANQRWQSFADVRRELAASISAIPQREYARPRITMLWGAAAVAVTAVLALVVPELLVDVEYRVYDSVLSWSAKSPPDSRIAMVGIDERSIASVGQWPWRRDVIGQLVAQLRSLGATAIVLNIFFAEPDRFQGSTDGSVPDQGAPDRLFAESLGAGKVVLGHTMTFEPKPGSTDQCVLHPFNVATPESLRTSNEAPFFEATGAVCSLPLLTRAAGRSGFLNVGPDRDSIVRRAPLLIGFNGRVYPSTVLVAVSMATGVDSAELQVNSRNRVSMRLGERLVQLDGRSNVFVRYRGPRGTFPLISAADIIGNRVPLESIQDKIVFVGTTAVGTRDEVATPLDTRFLTLELAATVADNLLQQDFVYRPPYRPSFETLIAVASGLIVTLSVAYMGLSAGVLAGFVALGTVWVGSVWLMSAFGMFLSPLYPSVGVALTLLSLIIARVSLERRRAEIAMRNVESAVLDR